METRVALVTGGTYGIGRAITLALARENFAVVAFGNQPAQGQETSRLAREEGLEPTILDGDVSARSDVERIVAEAARLYGRIDVLCNNAAIRIEGNLLETEEQTWDRIMAVNLKGVYLVTRAVLPHMICRQAGVVITTGSTSGYGSKNLIAYATAKGALAAFTMSLALDHAKDHVRAVLVVPGFTLTGMTEHSAPERLAAMAERSVAGRVGLPEDIANAVAFLASEKAATISGAILEVGGMHGQMTGLGPPRSTKS